MSSTSLGTNVDRWLAILIQNQNDLNGSIRNSVWRWWQSGQVATEACHSFNPLRSLANIIFHFLLWKRPLCFSIWATSASRCATFPPPASWPSASSSASGSRRWTSPALQVTGVEPLTARWLEPLGLVGDPKFLTQLHTNTDPSEYQVNENPLTARHPRKREPVKESLNFNNPSYYNSLTINDENREWLCNELSPYT